MAQQTAGKMIVDMATQPQYAGTVGLASIVTGASTYLEILTPFIGFFASLLGATLTILLSVNAYKKGRDDRKMRRLEREEKHLQIDALKKKQGKK